MRECNNLFHFYKFVPWVRAYCMVGDAKVSSAEVAEPRRIWVRQGEFVAHSQVTYSSHTALISQLHIKCDFCSETQVLMF